MKMLDCLLTEYSVLGWKRSTKAFYKISGQIFARLGTILSILTFVLLLTAVISPSTGQMATNSEPSSTTLNIGNYNKMYWTDAQTGKIQRASLDGTDIEDLVTGLGGLNDIALDFTAGKMYWTDSQTSKIQRADLDGNNIEDILTGVGYPIGLEVDPIGGKMYYVVSAADKIQRANLDGTGVQDLVSGLQDARHLILDLTNGKMYWTDAQTDSIHRANLDGTNVEMLISGLIGPFGIDLDLANGKIYWTDNSLGKVQRANLNGTNIEDLITGLGAPVGLTLDLAAGKMYWTADGTNKIQRANLDGTNIEDLVTGLSYPIGIALAEMANISPTITVDLSILMVNEGQTVTNSGTINDPDGDSILLAASAGTVINNGNGTWTWNFATSDGPTESQIVVISADDGKGGTGQITFDLAVNNVAPTVGVLSAPATPVQVNTIINTSTNFSDPGVLDTHTAVWDWGDGNTSSGIVSETNGSGSVNGSHSYTAPGVYTVKVTVMDKDGDSGESTFQFIVVFDPSGGFVTGGGWINSPAGAYTPDPSLTGKATFGFVSKYKKGANTPSGETQFQFRVANLDFHSTSYEWLVVAGPKAQFKGEGVINGEGNYGFILTAVDGQVNGGEDVDKFRIKIWDKNNGDISIYDNQMNSTDDAEPTIAIGGGNIVIHKDK